MYICQSPIIENHCMKKNILFLLSLLFGLSVNAQLFTIVNPHFTFHKTTDHSPAHWYIEVASNISVDTTLRWVAHFSNIPTQWSINFDDGTVNHSTIEDLDSGDFVLHPLTITTMPLKLIIGAMLNNTPGHGSVFFDIFDPNDRAGKQTIEFEFIITPSTTSVDEITNSEWYEIRPTEVLSRGKNVHIKIYDAQGRLLRSGMEELRIDNLSGVLFVHLSSREKERVVRILR